MTKPTFQPARLCLRPALRAAADFLTVRSGIILCALFFLAGLLLAGDYGMGVDELLQRQTAVVNLNYILGQGDFAELPKLHRHYGIAFELPLLLAERAFGIEDYYHIHRLRLILTHLFFLAGGFCCYLLAYRLFNNRLIALFALLLFLLHPRIYAHSFVNSKDLPFLSMFTITLYLAERAFRRDTVGAFVALGLAVGLLTNLRVMGGMLLPAVVALRVLDGWRPAGGPGRKHIVFTGVGFALAAGVTLYALSPYAWSNPGEYFANLLGQPANLYNITPRFQGEIFPPTELPPHYALTWLSITTPPPVLLLGVAGMLALVGWGIARPGAVFGNTSLRFGLLTLAGFALPMAAVALPGSGVYSYNGWRHLYFIYLPFVMAAAGGLYWLAMGFSRRWRWGVYGLTGLSLALTLGQMAQIHPWQNLYFNFLTARTVPDYLRNQYELDYWWLSLREAQEYVLNLYPGERVALWVNPQIWEIPPSLPMPEMRQGAMLPAEARRRLVESSRSRAADFSLGWGYDQEHRPDVAFNSIYTPRIYNSDLLGVRALDAARMDGPAVAAYERLYRDAVAGEPISRAGYDLYLRGRNLTFVKENCQPGERAGRFGVKVYQPDPGRMPLQMPLPGSYDYFDNAGVRLGGRCLAVLRLPDYPIAYFLAGQYGNWGRNPPLWASAHSFTTPGLGEVVAGLRDSRAELSGISPFALYQRGRRLIYYRESCAAGDTAAKFFLHITPKDMGDLPTAQRAYGFENRDFDFDEWAMYFDGQCLAVIALPDYPMAGIRTGQYAPGKGEIWAVEAGFHRDGLH